MKRSFLNVGKPTEQLTTYLNGRSVVVAITKVPKLERPACLGIPVLFGHDERNNEKSNNNHPHYCNQDSLLSVIFPLSGGSFPG